MTSRSIDEFLSNARVVWPTSSKVEDWVVENANVLLTRDGTERFCKELISDQSEEDPTAFDAKVVAFKEAVQGAAG